MTAFLAAAAALLLLAAGLLVAGPGKGPRPADKADPNLAWYRTRERELDQEDPVLVDEARLRLLEDGVVPGIATAEASDRVPAEGPVVGQTAALAGASAAPATPGAASRRQTALLVAVLVIGSALIYARTGSIEDVLIYRALGTLTPEDGEGARIALLERIEARSAERPDNLQYLNLLGRLHMAAEDFASAGESFSRLVERAPENPEALAMAAQARYLASGRRLDPQTQLLAERALAVDPEQRAALGLLGMASFEAGSYSAAVTYWERLRGLEERGSPGYEMLGEVLALARERAGLAPAPTGAPAASPATEQDGPGISVELRLADAAATDPAATVFVFARPPGQGGMPVAVRRLQASQLPLTLRLTDSDAMAGQRLSEAGRVVVSAQVSANGQPGEANALFSGQSLPVLAGDGDTQVTIELEPVATRG